MTLTYLFLVLLFWIASKLILWKVRSERTAISFSVLLWALFVFESFAFMVLVWDASLPRLFVYGPFFFVMIPYFGAIPIVIFIVGSFAYMVFRKPLRSFFKSYCVLVVGVFVFTLPTLISTLSTYHYLHQYPISDGWETAIFLLYHPAFYILGAMDLIISGEIIRRKRHRMGMQMEHSGGKSQL